MTSTEPAALPTSDRSGLDRRQLLRAGAWAAPAVLLATAVPAQAASDPTTDPTISNPGLVALAAICTKTGALNKTKHGFTLTNNASIPVTVTLDLDAQAWGLSPRSAKNNLISATTTSSGATYGGGYKDVWEPDSEITTSNSTGGSGKNAKRKGSFIITLAPGESVELWQENINAAGEPKIEARVMIINGRSVAGSYATFSFNWGGGCS